MSTATYPQSQSWMHHPSHMQSQYHESSGVLQQPWQTLPTSMSGYSMPQHPTHHNNSHLPPPNMNYMPQGMHSGMSQAPQQTLRPVSSQSSLQSVPPSPGLPMSQSQVMSQSHSLPHGMPASMHHIPQQLSMGAIPSTLAMSLPSPSQYRAPGQQPIPHQVVGQQGIRGVLPRSTGENSSAEDLCDPEQGSDGLWKCKLCGKTYRHAKHLRRHHARHTGETPYECHLCSRRFGRSDVLKRHYHKCATRRGVPVGDHLQGQRGHPRRRTGGPGGDNDSQGHGSPISDGHPGVGT